MNPEVHPEMKNEEIKKIKRPAFVWIISMFIFFTAGCVLTSYYMIYLGKIGLSQVQKEHLTSITLFDYVVSGIVSLTDLLGAVTLFNLRKQSFYFFVISLAINICTVGWYMFNKGLGYIQPLGYLEVLLSYMVYTAICVYIKGLDKKGVLR